MILVYLKHDNVVFFSLQQKTQNPSNCKNQTGTMKEQPFYSNKTKNEILRYHVLKENKNAFSQVCLLLVSKFHLCKLSKN